MEYQPNLILQRHLFLPPIVIEELLKIWFWRWLKVDVRLVIMKIMKIMHNKLQFAIYSFVCWMFYPGKNMLCFVYFTSSGGFSVSGSMYFVDYAFQRNNVISFVFSFYCLLLFLFVFFLYYCPLSPFCVFKMMDIFLSLLNRYSLSGFHLLIPVLLRSVLLWLKCSEIFSFPSCFNVSYCCLII